jgi:dihydroorotase
MNELLIKNGRVIDPAQGILDRRDIAINKGKIGAVAHDISATDAQRIIDAKGKIVTPGLIDIHTHVAEGLISIGVAPDEGGVFSGVTTVCDAGSLGWANFAGMIKYVQPLAKTDVFCFLNISSTGLAIMPEVWDWKNIDCDSMAKTIKENPETIKGVKVRATGSFVRNVGIEGIRRAKGVAGSAGLPLMVHLGIEPGEDLPDSEISDFTKKLLSLLNQGDILSHIYTWKKGGIINSEGTILPEAKEAVQRGVLLDVANAKTHFSFDTAKAGLEQGFLPYTISTDLTNININDSVFSLPVTMSKMLAAGLSLEQIVEMTTINPATALREDCRRGSLRVGFSADISIFELKEGEFRFADGVLGKTFKGKYLLTPLLILKNGVENMGKAHFDNAKSVEL